VDLYIHGDNDFFVRNQVAVLTLDLEIQPRLRVRGFVYDRPQLRAEERLSIRGEVELVSETSKIIYASRAFDVTRGRVDFQDEPFLEVAVEAMREFRIPKGQGAPSDPFIGAGDYTLENVELTFELRMPSRDAEPKYKLELSSSSGASRSDVLALVLTGRYPSDMSAAASAQPALEMAVGPVLGLVERPLEETLDLDLTLAPQSTGSLVIEAEKILSRRLRLYSYTPVGESELDTRRTFGLEYRLNNILYGELNNERVGLLNSSTGRLRFHLRLD